MEQRGPCIISDAFAFDTFAILEMGPWGCSVMRAVDQTLPQHLFPEGCRAKNQLVYPSKCHPLLGTQGWDADLRALICLLKGTVWSRVAATCTAGTFALFGSWSSSSETTGLKWAMGYPDSWSLSAAMEYRQQPTGLLCQQSDSQVNVWPPSMDALLIPI